MKLFVFRRAIPFISCGLLIIFFVITYVKYEEYLDVSEGAKSWHKFLQDKVNINGTQRNIFGKKLGVSEANETLKA